MRKIYTILSMLAIVSVSIAQSLPKIFEANKDFEGVSAINVKGDFCKVTFVKGDKVNVSAELMADKELEGYDVSMDLLDGVLTVEVKKPASGWTSHSGFVTLSIPDGLNLDITTASGYVTLRDFNNTNVKIETKSGKIVLANLLGDASVKSKSSTIAIDNVTGKVQTSSKGGSQTISNVKGSATVVAYSGAITIEQVDGYCKAETTDGAITLKNIKGDIKLKTKSGAMKLSDSKGTVNVFSGAGSVNFFNVQAAFDITSAKGAVIGNRIKFTASSTINTTEGKIKLKLDHKKEELSFLCESEKGMIVVYGKAKKKKNKFGKGPIVITTSSTTGSQNYY
jgi:hypothetical protein